MRSIGEKLDELLARQTREYLDTKPVDKEPKDIYILPEYKDCPGSYCCNGYDTWNKEVCRICNGKGRIVKRGGK